MQVSVRKDLITVPRDRGVNSQWIVKDPVSFTHFLFSKEELFLLKLFDGKRSLDEVRSTWQTEFQTKSLTEQQLKQTVVRFVRDRLVKVDNFGGGHRLHLEEGQEKKSQLLMKLSSPLVIRLGGVDPKEILDLLWLPGQILFHKLVVFVNLVIAASVLTYLLGHFEEIAFRAGTMASFFSAKNMLLMLVLIGLVKVIHELGHAVACRKFGGECFEIGVLLLAFLPTLYCDVTDSWMFREKWKRIMVAFAGIYIEILLATICAVLWLMTGPGLANSIFFNVAVMCSINTLFINGNPLLKYDGYYILSDLVDQPNLQQLGQRNFRSFKNSFFFDGDREIESFWLVLFGGLSVLYRWFVILSIITGVFLLLKSYDLGRMGEAVALVLMAATGYRMFKQHKMTPTVGRRKLNLPRAVATMLGLALVGLLAIYLPLPSSVYCNFRVESKGAWTVYAGGDGELALNTGPYSQVEKNAVLGSIKSESLIENRVELQSEREHLQDRAARLKRQLDQGTDVAAELKIVESELTKVTEQLVLLNKEIDDLSIRAEVSGMLRPIGLDAVNQTEGEGGTFFDSAYRNCLVARGQPLFSIESGSKRLVSYLGESDVEFVAVDQAVDLIFDHDVSNHLVGIIKEIIEIDVDLNSMETEQSGLETYVDQTGAVRTLQTPYRVIIELENFPDTIRVGAGGRGKISVPKTTLVEKVWFVLDRWWKEQNY